MFFYEKKSGRKTYNSLSLQLKCNEFAKKQISEVTILRRLRKDEKDEETDYNRNDDASEYAGCSCRGDSSHK